MLATRLLPPEVEIPKGARLEPLPIEIFESLVPRSTGLDTFIKWHKGLTSATNSLGRGIALEQQDAIVSSLLSSLEKQLRNQETLSFYSEIAESLVQGSLRVRPPGFIHHPFFGKVDFSRLENPRAYFSDGPSVYGIQRLAFELQLAIKNGLLGPLPTRKTRTIYSPKLAKELKRRGWEVSIPSIPNPEIYLLARQAIERSLEEGLDLYSGQEGLERLAEEVGYNSNSLYKDFYRDFPQLMWRKDRGAYSTSFHLEVIDRFVKGTLGVPCPAVVNHPVLGKIDVSRLENPGAYLSIKSKKHATHRLAFDLTLAIENGLIEMPPGERGKFIDVRSLVYVLKQKGWDIGYTCIKNSENYFLARREIERSFEEGLDIYVGIKGLEILAKMIGEDMNAISGDLGFVFPELMWRKNALVEKLFYSEVVNRLVKGGFRVLSPGSVEHSIFGPIDVSNLEDPTNYFSTDSKIHAIQSIAFHLQLALENNLLASPPENRPELIRRQSLVHELKQLGWKLPNVEIQNPETYFLARWKIDQSLKEGSDTYVGKKGLETLAIEVGCSQRALSHDLRQQFPELNWRWSRLIGAVPFYKDIADGLDKERFRVLSPGVVDHPILGPIDVSKLENPRYYLSIGSNKYGIQSLAFHLQLALQNDLLEPPPIDKVQVIDLHILVAELKQRGWKVVYPSILNVEKYFLIRNQIEQSLAKGSGAYVGDKGLKKLSKEFGYNIPSISSDLRRDFQELGWKRKRRKRKRA